MVDFILLTFFVLTFIGGVWCGNAYGGFVGLIQKCKAEIKSWLS